MPVRFRSGRFSVVILLFWYEVVFATKAKTSDLNVSLKSNDTGIERTGNGLVGILTAEVAKIPVILNSRETNQVR